MLGKMNVIFLLPLLGTQSVDEKKTLQDIVNIHQ